MYEYICMYVLYVSLCLSVLGLETDMRPTNGSSWHAGDHPLSTLQLCGMLRGKGLKALVEVPRKGAALYPCP